MYNIYIYIYIHICIIYIYIIHIYVVYMYNMFCVCFASQRAGSQSTGPRVRACRNVNRGRRPTIGSSHIISVAGSQEGKSVKKGIASRRGGECIAV